MTEKSEAKAPVRISDEELQRRWTAVRKAMKEKGIDFLILQNNASNFAGFVKWFTDISVYGSGYPSTVIFPREDEMTTIWHGGRPPAEPMPPAAIVRGVKKRIAVPIIPSLRYSTTFDSESVVEELEPFKNCRIGFVGMGFIPAAFYKYVTEHLPSAKFEDATGLVDDIKVIKSDEEIQLLRETCELEDKVFEFVLYLVTPGRIDAEIRKDVIHKCLKLGMADTNIMLMSAPPGMPLRIGSEPRVLEEGDQLSILIETNSPTWYWGELGRTICIGKIPPETEEAFEAAREAQQRTADALRPGVAPRELFETHNEFVKSKGYPPETRIFAHGQGLDMMESPALNREETNTIQARMFLAIHPALGSKKASGGICDNYLVRDEGPAEWMHKTPRKIFVI